MKSVLSIAVSSLLLVSPSLGQGIVEILKANNLTAFAAELSTFPNIIDLINGRNDITVFAPTNSVIEGPYSKNTTLRLRQNSGESRTAALIGKKRPKPTQERTKKRQATVDLPDSNYEIHYSVLEDPEFVNLGPDQPGRFVSNSAGRPDGVGLAFLEVVTGNGDVVSQVDGPFKFNRGVIYSVNK